MADQTPFFSDEEKIILNSNGMWVADGTEITHIGTQKLFARSLVHKKDGYFLEVGRESKAVTVEDTPYFVVRVDGNPREGFKLTLNNETQETLDGATLAYRPGRLTCTVMKGKAEAKFLHRSYFDFLKWLEEDDKTYFVTIKGKKFILAARKK